MKGKFSLILFVYNLMIGCFKKKKENNPRNAFEKRKKPGLKFNPRLALIQLWKLGLGDELQHGWDMIPLAKLGEALGGPGPPLIFRGQSLAAEGTHLLEDLNLLLDTVHCTYL